MRKYKEKMWYIPTYILLQWKERNMEMEEKTNRKDLPPIKAEIRRIFNEYQALANNC